MPFFSSLFFKKFLFCLKNPSFWRFLQRGIAPSIEHINVLVRLDFSYLLDVGANRGQFSLLSKYLFPPVPIHAYEPFSPEAIKFKIAFSSWSDVTLHPVALGSKHDEVEFHVSRSSDSSSILPIGALQKRLFQGHCHGSKATVEAYRKHRRFWVLGSEC